ncbi:UDP-N-acetylglucosamine diphosphorylase [Aureococcus anophagefferens]|uniref:UDP-N-acetylglucosamine diphosphorylase n=1 Tax=Aureococcus anophagefferens TaxID=44056 RepID=A0ABR1G9H3_AURAN
MSLSDLRLEELRRAWDAAGQGHVLAHAASLAPAERDALVAQLQTIDPAAATAAFARATAPPPARAPREALAPLPDVPALAGHPDRAAWRARWASRAGRAAQEARGAAARGETRALVRDDVRRDGRATRSAYFAREHYFGLRADQCFFFAGALPAFDAAGKVLLETPPRVCVAPTATGRGGALAASGALADMERRGVAYVSQYCVDNALVKAIAHYDGARVAAPAAPNGVKLERFIFDAFPHAAPFPVLEGDRAADFAPVKNAPGNADSPDTARALVSAAHGAEAGLSQPNFRTL